MIVTMSVGGKENSNMRRKSQLESADIFAKNLVPCYESGIPRILWNEVTRMCFGSPTKACGMLAAMLCICLLCVMQLLGKPTYH